MAWMQKAELEPIMEGVLEHAKFRQSIMTIAREALQRFKHDLALADPLTLLGRSHATAVVIVHGADDEDVPISLSRSLVQAHPWVELHEVPGGHFEPIEPGSEVWPTVVAALSPGRAPGARSSPGPRPR